MVVTFSGGEPLLQAKPLAQLAKEVHKRGLNITTFTGYTLEQLQNMHILTLMSYSIKQMYSIDGPFPHRKKRPTLQFRGSSNQRIIDMQKTRESGQIVLIEY